MPGFDGTGPRGQGPMTGKGGGFCLLRLPDDAKAGCSGYAGREGRPFPAPGHLRAQQIRLLKERLRLLQAGLDGIRSRLVAQEAERGKKESGSPAGRPGPAKPGERP